MRVKKRLIDAAAMAKIPTVTQVVAIALIDPCGRVLLQKRKATAHHGGLWEFPGGKVECGESREAALIREIDEELGVIVAAVDLGHEGEVEGVSGAGTQLVLDLYRCARWQSEPRCLDAAAIGWFTTAQAATLAVPPLDQPFVARLAAIVAATTGGGA
jgi:8-oxo-dGTP diphosphatase